MKKALYSFLVIGLLFSCGPKEGQQNVGASEFQTAIAGETGAQVLDVRTVDEFQNGHIEGAINIDVEGMTFDGDIAQLDKSKTYAVYCHSGRRSGIAVGKMSDAGFTKLFNLDGGIQVWQAAGLPLVTQ